MPKWFKIAQMFKLAELKKLEKKINFHDDATIQCHVSVTMIEVDVKFLPVYRVFWYTAHPLIVN